MPNKARKWVIAALEEIAKIMPFPILGVDSDNGSEFINHHLLDWCEKRQITFTRSRPGNSNDGAHVEQKNWAIVRTVVGYHRYDTTARAQDPRAKPILARSVGRHWQATAPGYGTASSGSRPYSVKLQLLTHELA